MIALIALATAIGQLPNEAFLGTSTHDTCSPPSNTTRVCFEDDGHAGTVCELPEPLCASGYQYAPRLITQTAYPSLCSTYTWTWRCLAVTTTPTTTATTTPSTSATTTPTTSVTTTPPTTTTTTTTTTATTTTATVPDVSQTNDKKEEEKSLSWFWIAVIVLAGAIVLAIIYFTLGFKACGGERVAPSKSSSQL